MKTLLNIVTRETKCDGCQTSNHPVLVDVPHPSGPWGYFCLSCYEQFKTSGTEALGSRLPTDQEHYE